MTIKNIIGLVTLTFSSWVLALDSDVYKESIIEPDAKILVLLDTSGSMRCSGDKNQPEFNGAACGRMLKAGGKRIDTGKSIVDTGVYTNAQPEARMKSIKDILNDFIAPDSPDAWPDSFQVGLSVFSYPGSAVIRPVQALSDEVTDEAGIRTISEGGISRPLTARDILARELNAVTGSGVTPTMGALFEAGMYMSSQAVVTAVTRKYPIGQEVKNFPPGSIANWTRKQNQRIAHQGSFSGGAITPSRNNNSTCLRAMQLYGAEYGRFTEACATEDIIATGELNYLGPQDDPQSCVNGQKHIILITDGFPQASSGATRVRDDLPMATWMNRFLTDNKTTMGTHPSCPLNASASNVDAWNCMHAIAKKLKDSHNTTIHVISFLADRSTKNNLSKNNEHLKAIADVSDGSFYLAQRPEEIKLAIKEISVAVASSASFASPSIAVDNFNPFAHQNMVSYSLFRPSSSNFWYGNLKRYRLGELNGISQVLDQKDKPAIDLTTGKFNEDATSFWSNINDGNNILLGGAVSNLRKGDMTTIFTDFGKGSSTCKNALGRDAALRRVSTCKDGIQDHLYSRAMIGRNPNNKQHVEAAKDDATHWFKWLTGVDHEGREWRFLTKQVPAEDLPAAPISTGKNDYYRQWMGAPLHSSPFIVNYKTISEEVSENADGDAIKERVFISTNDGFLYAFTAWDGKEVFRFYPEPLLDKIEDYTSYGQGDLNFGLDGQWTVWREDKADNTGHKNGIITPTDGDKIALFGGMRRGGDYYYALDVTQLQNPRIAFKIHGAANSKQPSEAALKRLGQTWSKPELINVKINDKPEVLMVVGGGYDTQYDAPKEGEAANYNPGENNSTLGNAIYFVYTEGAKAGQVAAWVSSDANGLYGNRHRDMRYSVPGRIATLDLNYDGFADHIYAADLAGQVFRVDLDNNNTSAAKLIERTTTLAKFGVTGRGNNLAAKNRRFFEGPSVAYIEDNIVSKRYIAIALASGWREHPFETEAENRMYVIRDEEPLTLMLGQKITDSPFPLSHADLNKTLIDVDKISQADINQSQVNPNSKLARAVGLTKVLPKAGEKSFGIPLIANNKVYFSTLIPSDLDDPSIIDSASCSKDTGDSRVYGIDLFTGEGALPASPTNPNNTATVSHVEYDSPYNAGDISVNINQQGEPTLSSGQTPIVQLPLPGNIAEKMHWRQMNSGSQVERDHYYQQ